MANDVNGIAELKVTNIDYKTWRSSEGIPVADVQVSHRHYPLNTKFTDFLSDAHNKFYMDSTAKIQVLSRNKIRDGQTIIGGVTTFRITGYGSFQVRIKTIMFSYGNFFPIYDFADLTFLDVGDGVEEPEIESPGIIYKESDDLAGYNMLFRLRTNYNRNVGIPIAEIPEGETVYINWGDNTPDTVLTAGIPTYIQVSHNYTNISTKNPYVNVKVKGNFSKFGVGAIYDSMGNAILRWEPEGARIGDKYFCSPRYILGKFPSSLTHLGHIPSSTFGWPSDHLPLPKDIFANCENLLYLVQFFKSYDFNLYTEYFKNCAKLKNIDCMFTPGHDFDLPSELLKNNPEIEDMSSAFSADAYAATGYSVAPPDLFSYTPKLKNIKSVLSQSSRYNRRVHTRLKVSLKDCPLIENAKYAFWGYEEVENYEKFFLYNPLLTAESLRDTFRLKW